jgi:hypothetical protein
VGAADEEAPVLRGMAGATEAEVVKTTEVVRVSLPNDAAAAEALIAVSGDAVVRVVTGVDNVVEFNARG